MGEGGGHDLIVLALSIATYHQPISYNVVLPISPGTTPGITPKSPVPQTDDDLVDTTKFKLIKFILVNNTSFLFPINIEHIEVP